MKRMFLGATVAFAVGFAPFTGYNHASAANDNVYPSFDSFKYAASMVGKPEYFQEAGTIPNPLPPADYRYYSSQNGIVYDFFFYGVNPIGVGSGKGFLQGGDQAFYTVSTFNTHANAMTINAQQKANTYLPIGAGGPNAMALLPLAHPANSTEWVRAADLPRDCIMKSGMVYRNVEMGTVISSTGDNQPGQPYCTNTLRWVLHIERLMLNTAMQTPITPS